MLEALLLFLDFPPRLPLLFAALRPSAAAKRTPFTGLDFPAEVHRADEQDDHADARPGLFVTFTVTVTRSPSAGSARVTFNVPASMRTSAWSNGSICTLMFRDRFPVFGFAGSASRKPLSLTDRVTL